LIDKVLKFAKYYTKAETEYNIHSPFVYDFIQDVLDTNKHYYAFNPLEHERKILLTNHNEIAIQDFGAGSKTGQAMKKSIGDIAKKVVSNKDKCRTLFNLVNKYQPHTIIELGTSLGLSAMYMAKAYNQANIYTIEADPAVYKIAKMLLERNHLSNVHPINATFEQVLPSILDQISEVDLAYIDGNHSYEATMFHFHTLKKKSNHRTIFVFDDIYWSDGMTRAWQEIKQDKAVAYTIDTFDFGFVFFNPVMEKQHFTLIDYWKKPYKIGLF
jgi:predicted O-methyltransferase YrrM